MLGCERTPRRFDSKHAASYNRHRGDRQGIHTIEILAKFGDAPIVRCQDTVLDEGKQSTLAGEEEWALRRYATTWEIATRLSEVDSMLPYAHYNHNGSGFTSTWQRYSSLKVLAHKIIDVALPVIFYSGIPHTTFTVVNLDTFDFATTQPLRPPTAGQQTHAT